MSLQRLGDILTVLIDVLEGGQMSQLIVDRVESALTETLEHSHVDGYFYLRDEWRLKRLWYHPSSNCYYALIEIDSPKPEFKTALYQIDANDEAWGTGEGEYSICVGRSPLDLAEQCQEILVAA